MYGRPFYRKPDFYRELMGWMLLVLVAALPVLVLAATSDSSRSVILLARGLGEESQLSCWHLRVLLAVLSYVAGLVVLMLIWWRFGELRTLRRIFDVPWRGLSEDVESVGAIEGVVRAVVCTTLVLVGIVVLMIALGMTADKESPSASPVAWLLGFADSREDGCGCPPDPKNCKAADKKTLAALKEEVDKVRTEVGRAALIRSHEHKGGDHGGGGPTGPSPDPLAPAIDRLARQVEASLKQLEQLGGIDSSLAALKVSAEHLAALNNIRDSLANLSRDGAVPVKLAEITAAIEKLNATLSGKPKAPDGPKDPKMPPDGRKPPVDGSKVPPDGRKPPVDGPKAPPDGPKQPPTTQTPPPPSATARCRARTFPTESKAVLQEVAPMASAAALRRFTAATRYTIVEHQLFFDPGAKGLSPIAEKRLQYILAVVRAGKGGLVISGEADGNSDGDDPSAVSYARARTVAGYVERNGHPPVLGIAWITGKATASEPYRRIVRIEVLQPCSTRPDAGPVAGDTPREDGHGI